jgi:hypothetical protein
MGCNFYLHPQADCPCCKRPYERLHIGKSSYGWCFSLHVIPDLGIHTLEDWQERWSQPGAFIRDEYGDEVSPEEMLAKIAERAHNVKTDWDSDWWRHRDYYQDETDFHYKNMSERGPNFLLRHRVDGVHCCGQGPGTYDYILGYFS